MTTTIKTATTFEKAQERVMVDRVYKGTNVLTGKAIFGAAKWYVLDDSGEWKRNKRAAEKILKELGFTLTTFEKALNAPANYSWKNSVEETAAENTTTEAEENTAQVEYKPQTEWENPHDFTTVGNLNGQPRKYVDPEAIAAPKGFWANRINGTYDTHINGEYVSFENHSIAYIDAEKKLGYRFKKSDAGRKIFYRGNQRFAASKIVEAYMNGEIAAEQNKAHHEFFNANKTAYNNFFQVLFRVTTADDRIHNFERTFATFDAAKALVDEFTATFDEPTDIIIKQNKQNGEIYYKRTDGNPGNYTDAYFGNDGFDPEVFSLLPNVDDLNDVEDEPTTEDLKESAERMTDAELRRKHEELIDTLITTDNPDVYAKIKPQERIYSAEMHARKPKPTDAPLAFAYELTPNYDGSRNFKIGDKFDGDIITVMGDLFDNRWIRIYSPTYKAELRRDRYTKDNALTFSINIITGQSDKARLNVKEKEFFDFLGVETPEPPTEAESLTEEQLERRIEQLERRISATASERGEWYGALEEAEADDETPQRHIDYLKDKIDRLGEAYNELWAELRRLRRLETEREIAAIETSIDKYQAKYAQLNKHAPKGWRVTSDFSYCPEKPDKIGVKYFVEYHDSRIATLDEIPDTTAKTFFKKFMERVRKKSKQKK